MPIPMAVASFNKKVTNRVTGPFAGHLPGFAVVTHRGRKSRTYVSDAGQCVPPRPRVRLRDDVWA